MYFVFTRKATSLACAAAFAGGVPSSFGLPITLIFETQISGVLNGENFPLSNCRLEARGDTDDVVFQGWWGLDSNGPARLSIDGVGDVDLLLATNTGVVNWGEFNPWSVSFGTAGINGNTIYRGPRSFLLNWWMMQTSIGPVYGEFTLWGGGPFPTSAGTLIPEIIVHPGTFTAIVVPEPATASLLVFVALAAAGVLRRRR